MDERGRLRLDAVARFLQDVAISRAQCLAYLVCSPRLLEVDCRTIEHMRLANALCRFVELAHPEKRDLDTGDVQGIDGLY